MEQQEFENIAYKMRRSVINTCRKQGLDETTSDDVAQDVMLKLWAMHSEIEAKEKIGSLAVMMARHLIIDKWRRRHPTISLESQWNLSDEHYSTPDISIEDKENERWLESRISKLPHTQYEVLRLRQVECKTKKEIASILGIEESSVPTILARARKELLREIKKRIK